MKIIKRLFCPHNNLEYYTQTIAYDKETKLRTCTLYKCRLCGKVIRKFED